VRGFGRHTSCSAAFLGPGSRGLQTTAAAGSSPRQQHFDAQVFHGAVAGVGQGQEMVAFSRLPRAIGALTSTSRALADLDGEGRKRRKSDTG